ncbi:MAG: 3-isopropylmalate dehydrogenase [Chloroflexi bacterium]|nr:3-isopropylmalate dehydrogenase [Chloroflexota bacterium]
MERGCLKTYRIGVLGGDGIGPEVTREAIKVLRAAAERTGFAFETIDYPFGAEHYLKTGETMPQAALDECAGLDAVLVGALGDPRLEPGFIEKPIIFGLRQGLDLYVNYRPIKLYAEHLCPLKDKTPADVDIVVLRENTEDVYAGAQGIFKKGTPDEVAIAEMIFTRKGTERIIRYAFETARRRAAERGPGAARKPKVTMVDKANAIRSMDLWTRVFAEVGREYPEIETDHAYIDAACMWMVKNPEWFDVVVTSNLFGDIITDLGAMIQGGLGIAASGNIHPGRSSMFEPIHGSAPKYANLNVASPLGAIAAAGMLCEHIGERAAARLIEDSIRGLLVSKRIPSVDARSGIGTREIGDMVAAVVSGGK